MPKVHGLCELVEITQHGLSQSLLLVYFREAATLPIITHRSVKPHMQWVKTIVPEYGEQRFEEAQGNKSFSI